MSNVLLPTRETARGEPQCEAPEGCWDDEVVRNVRRELVRRLLRVVAFVK